MKIVKISFLMIASMLMLVACGGKEKSAVTGWNLNDTEWGGFDRSSYTEQITGPGLVFIEGGSFQMGRVAEETRFSWNNLVHTVSVSSFYMDETEVSNFSYREFVYWMNRAYGEEYPELVKQIYPDTTVWRSRLSWVENFVENYFQCAMFNDYPVVGVTWEQASQFCKWRTDRVNEKILVDAGIIELAQSELTGSEAFQTDVYLAGLYKGEGQGVPNLDPAAGGENRNVRRSDGILLPNYRLPTEAEWEFAALGMIGNTYDERVVEHKTYPWAGQSLRSANKKYYGQFLANFKRSRGDAMGVAGNLNDGWEYTAPVMWYFPNDYGLYHMAGNVAEWCGDVYRKDSNPIGADDQNPYRGNVYQYVAMSEDGEEAAIDEATGSLIYQNVPDDMNRRNYRQADNINYLDGDWNSSIYDFESKEATSASGWLRETDEDEDYAEEGGVIRSHDEQTNQMYHRSDSTDKANITSMINNRVRVVKGGSWRDRAYWMQCGTRRYYDQDRSTSWIGFRCAMDRMGSRTM